MYGGLVGTQVRTSGSVPGIKGHTAVTHKNQMVVFGGTLINGEYEFRADINDTVLIPNSVQTNSVMILDTDAWTWVIKSVRASHLPYFLHNKKISKWPSQVRPLTIRIFI